MTREEYQQLRERLNKASEIICSIEDLKHFASRIEDSDHRAHTINIEMSNAKYAILDIDEVDVNIVGKVAKAAAKAARAEIARLEAELAEL